MSSRREPRWLSRRLIEAMQLDQIRQHGGSAGLRDEDLLESALARPRTRWGYEETADIATLAASLSFALAKNHPFIDGNKRIAFSALFTFLGVSGWELDTDESDAARTMLAVAEGSLSEDDFASWIRSAIRPVKPARRR